MTMESGGPGKPPISPRTLSMIFNSGDFSRLLQSRETMMSNSVASRPPRPAPSPFASTDSTAAIFQSADFLKSLGAYKDSMSQAGGSGGSDPAAFFRSADFLKSLDTLPKERREGVFRSMDFLQSLDFSSTDGQKLGKDIFSSVEGKKLKEVFASTEGKQQMKDIFSSRDWARDYNPTGSTFNKSVFASQDSVTSVGSGISVKSLSRAGKPMPPKKARQAEFYSSQDWLKNYSTNQAEVQFDSAVFKSGDSTERKKLDPPAKMASSLPAPAPAPKAASANKWMKMYQAGLSNAGPPAFVPQPKPAPPAAAAAVMPPLSGASSSPTPMDGGSVSGSVSGGESKSTKKPKKKRIYKSRKVIPEVKQFVQFIDADVLLGRGGLSNKHPGNKRYRQEIENAKAVYRSASKDEKTEWANLLVEYVKKYGGRFLEKDKATGQWYIVPDVVARRKAGQALREDNTPESRKEKRDRYKKAHGKL